LFKEDAACKIVKQDFVVGLVFFKQISKNTLLVAVSVTANLLRLQGTQGWFTLTDLALVASLLFRNI